MAPSYDCSTGLINYLLKAEINLNDIASLIDSEFLGEGGVEGCRTNSNFWRGLGVDKFENPWLKNKHLHFACLYDIFRSPSLLPGQWLLIQGVPGGMCQTSGGCSLC